MSEAQSGLARKEFRLTYDSGYGATRNGTKEFTRVFFQFVERGFADQTQGHAIRAVVGFVEFADLCRRSSGERFFIAGGKFALAAARRVEFARDTDDATLVILDVAHCLVVDGVDLSTGELRVEFRRDEELCEPIKSTGEGSVAHLKLVICDIASGVGVIVSAILTHVVAVFRDIGVFFRAQEQHMFEEVGETLAIEGVIDLTHIYHQGCARFVELRIRDEKDAKPVFEDKTTELGRVGGRCETGRELWDDRGREGRGSGEQSEGGSDKTRHGER